MKKANISLKRKVTIYYQRFILALKISILVLLVSFFFTDLFKTTNDNIRNFFYDFSARHGLIFKTLVIEVNKNVTTQDILGSLEADEGTPIFAVNISGVKDRLKNHIWVQEAIVERRLPSTIYIAIIERAPIAIWQFQQKLYLIDAEGNRISKYDKVGFEELINVVGQDANIYANSLLDELNHYPNLAAKVWSAVRQGQRRWDLKLEQGITVKMPEEEFNKAYDYLHSLNKKNRLFGQDYKVLDLRDPKKYYLE